MKFLLEESIEDNLPQDMHNVKRKALSGDVEAQYQIALYYRGIWNNISNAEFAKMNKDTQAFFAAYLGASSYFLYKAKEQGHAKAEQMLK